jgi:hypothetical protein
VNKCRKFLRLSGRERWWLFQALLLLPLTALALRLLGLRSSHSVLADWARRCPRSRRAARLVADTEKLTRMVQLASAHGFFRPHCLHRSLVLWWLLHRAGIESELRIGVSKQAGGLRAHAWVERGGTALNERGDVRQRFAPFASSLLPMGPTTP